MGIIDRKCRLIGLYLYDQQFEAIPFNTEGQLGIPYFIRISHLRVVDIKFLFSCPKPTIVVLQEVQTQGRLEKFIVRTQMWCVRDLVDWYSISGDPTTLWQLHDVEAGVKQDRGVVASRFPMEPSSCVATLEPVRSPMFFMKIFQEGLDIEGDEVEEPPPWRRNG
ncbi:DNA damage-binding protein 1a [Orobanche minor]